MNFKHKKHPVIKLIIHIFLLAVFMGTFALFLAWFIQERAMGGQENTVDLWNEKPEICWYSAIVIFAVTVLAAALIGRPFISSGILFAATLLLTYANEQKMAMRGEPVLVDDMLMAGEADGLLNLVDINEFLQIATAAALAIVLGIVLNHVARKIWPYNKNYGYLRRHLVAPRLIIATMAVCGIAITLQPFVHKGNHVIDVINIFGNDLEFICFDQTVNYEQNGFIVGFVYGLAKMQTEAPKDYGEQTISQIAKKYEKIKNDDERKNINEVVENVIVVLNESGYDPELLKEVYPHKSGDVIPNFRELAKKYPSGYMYSPEYGGGTANIEFEVFTGLSNYWPGTVPYVSLVPKMNIVPSVASFTSDAGFETKAIHSYTSGLYNRSTALHKQGFDKFIAVDEMSSKKHNSLSPYVNDWSAYYETLNKLRENDNPQAIALITMQHHGAYDSAHYPAMNYLPEDEDYVAGQYYESLHNADEALGQFIDKLDTFDEKTVVLWFGDHAGGVFSGVPDENKQVHDYKHMTPYFVYANFDLGDVELDLPTVSPNCLTNTMYNVINVKKPTLGYLLDAVCKDDPILAVPYFANFGPEETEAYHDYELVNYDMLSGKQYWLKYTK